MYPRTRGRLSKLRSNLLLLLVVCGMLLAAPAIVMALITDLGNNTSPTIQSEGANIADPGADPRGNTSPAIQDEEANVGDLSAGTLPAQAIQIEESNDAAGKTVTLTGSNWRPGESVHIKLTDDQGKTWSRNVRATADASGRIQVWFQLPDGFAATYEVTAMGEQSGVATTSFTDGDVSFHSTFPAPASWTVNYTTHGGGNSTDNTSCAAGGTDESKTIFPDATGTASVGISDKGSMRLGTVTVPADSTLVFDHWTDQNGNTVANDACLSGDPSGPNGNITDLIAHFDSAKQTPEAQPQPIVSTDEDTAKTITLSGTDEDGDNLIFYIVTGPSHGTLGPSGDLTCTGTVPRTCSADVTYTPDKDYNGFDIFSFKADDGTEGSHLAPVSILVNPVNDAPVATDETKTMSEDGGPLSIDFGDLLSDVETSDANLTYGITDPDPAKGSLSGTGSTREFTPAANFNGTVNIDYTPTDRGDPDECSAANPPCAAAEISARKTVTVAVDAVNDAPSFTKGPDQRTVEDAGAQSITDWATAVSAGPNESGQRVTFEVTNDNKDLFTWGGQPSVAPDGTLTYTPAGNANGTANVTVKLHDDGDTANGGADESAEQSFTIAIDSANDAPTFQKGGNQTVNEDSGAQEVNGWATDISAGSADENGQRLTFEATSDTNLFTAGGQPEIDANGKLTYEAAPNANGSATVAVKLRDDGGTLSGGANTSAEQSFTINLTAGNDTPIARADTLATVEDRKLVFPSSDLVGNDSEGADNESSQTLTVTEVYEGTAGTVSLGSNGNITFTPEADFSGYATFRYLVCDDGSPSKCSVQRATANVTVSPLNDAPVVGNQSVTTDEDTAIEVTLSASDAEGDAVGYIIVSAPRHGTLSGSGVNLIYTPEADYRGPDSFTFKASDGLADSVPATVSIMVDTVNDAPTVSNLQGDVAANEGDVKTYTFDIADVDSGTFSASVDCGGVGKGELVAGSAQISGTNGAFKCKFLDGLISPTPINISVRVSDGDKLSNVESKSVSVGNVAPAPTGVSSSSQNALAGTLNPVTFTGTATDVSPIDLTTGFSWRWGIDGGAFGPFGAVGANTFTVGGVNNQLYFSTCGTHTVEAQAGDKDGGVSAESSQSTQSVSVYDGAFSPPLVDGTTNMVQKGQVIPVEISVGCGTTNLTNLTPHIQLLSGNVSPETESGRTTVTTPSVLAADTTQTMRPVDGGYIYNLQVPGNATANQKFTILVNPFGATADHAATGMYVVLKVGK
jgi:Bacterial Ig domain